MKRFLFYVELVFELEQNKNVKLKFSLSNWNSAKFIIHDLSDLLNY